MSDKKDKSDADLEANLARIANAKPRRRHRRDNIYERFITRVESIEETENLQVDDFDTTADDHSEAYHNNDTGIGFKSGLLESAIHKSPLKPLKNADKLSSYEPLSAAELDLFATQDQDFLEDTIALPEANNNTTSVSLDFSDKEDEEGASLVTTSYAVDIDESEVLAVKEQHLDIDGEDINVGSLETPSLKKAKKKKEVTLLSKQASNKKPIILGMVLGSLMIVGAVLTLIATGVLTTEPNAASVPVAKDVSQPSPTNQSPVNDNEQNIVLDVNTSSTVAGEPNADTPTVEPLTPNPQKLQTTVDEASDSTPKAEPAITYEDFREESQNTLYRETND